MNNKLIFAITALAILFLTGDAFAVTEVQPAAEHLATSGEASSQDPEAMCYWRTFYDYWGRPWTQWWCN